MLGGVLAESHSLVRRAEGSLPPRCPDITVEADEAKGQGRRGGREAMVPGHGAGRKAMCFLVWEGQGQGLGRGLCPHSFVRFELFSCKK